MVSAPRWAGAMLAADLAHVEGTVSSVLNGANVVSGLGMGLLEVLAMAYMLDALRGLKPFHPGRNGNKGRVNYRFWGDGGVRFWPAGADAVRACAVSGGTHERGGYRDGAAGPCDAVRVGGGGGDGTGVRGGRCGLRTAGPGGLFDAAGGHQLAGCNAGCVAGCRCVAGCVEAC